MSENNLYKCDYCLEHKGKDLILNPQDATYGEVICKECQEDKEKNDSPILIDEQIEFYQKQLNGYQAILADKLPDEISETMQRGERIGKAILRTLEAVRDCDSDYLFKQEIFIMAKTIKKLRKKYWIVLQSYTAFADRWDFLKFAQENRFTKAKAADKFTEKIRTECHWEMWLHINGKPLKAFVSDNYPY
jgi:hypothetical protein